MDCEEIEHTKKVSKIVSSLEVGHDHNTLMNDTDCDMSPQEEITEKCSTSFSSEKDLSNNSCRSTETSPSKYGAFSSSNDDNVKAENSSTKKFIYTFKLQSSHIIRKRHGVKVYGCEVCLKSYRHVFSLKRHFLRNHVNTKYLTEADISNCKIKCQELSITEVHNISEDSHGSQNFSLDEHNEETDEAHVLSDEPQTSGNSVSDLYRCHNCLYSKFASCAEVRNHYEQHSGGSKTHYTCEKCGATFTQQQAFLRHQSSHSEKTSFVCSTCKMSFSNKKSHAKHCLSHSSGKTCKHCSKVYSTSANRRRHERIHEGLKPYPCKHCNMGFTQSNNLKKHIQEQHSELYFACSQCSKLHSSQASLTKHLAEAHSIISGLPNLQPGSSNLISPVATHLTTEELLQPSNSREIVTKPSLVIKKPISIVPDSSDLSAKVYTCNVCKKNFKSYFYMLRHRNQIHPFINRKRKPHRKKMQLPASKPILRKRVYVPRVQQETDANFYLYVSQQIADNLVNYLDGKLCHLKLNQCNDDNLEQVDDRPCVSSLESLSSYNFPPDFDLNNSINTGGEETSISTSLSPKINSTGDISSSINSDIHVNGSYSNNDDGNFNCDAQLPSVKTTSHQNMSLEERKALIGRRVPIIYVCCVCMNRYDSVQATESHKFNNHPNVLCTFIEIEGSKNIPPTVPPDLVNQFYSPLGMLQHCTVPPLITHQSDLLCTKCKSKFPCLKDLHLHILECGGNEASISSFHHRRRQRRIKRTMKNRIDTALRQRAYTSQTVDVQLSTNSNPPKKNKKNAQFLSKRNNHNKNTFKTALKVGKPQSMADIKVVCSGCKKVFKDKSFLKSHMSECCKRVGKKSKKVSSINDGVCNNEVDSSSITKNNEQTHVDQPLENLCQVANLSLDCIINSESLKATHEGANEETNASDPGKVSLIENELSNVENSDKTTFCESSRGDDINEAAETKPDVMVKVPSSTPSIDITDLPLNVLNNQQSSPVPELKCAIIDTIANEITCSFFDKNKSSPSVKEQNSSLDVDQHEVKGEIKEPAASYNTGVKKDDEQTKHTCPYCLLDFSYLTNYHRHLAVCSPMKLKQCSSTNASLSHLPKKDEVESSMLHLLRHQSRQSQMMRDAESNSSCSGKRFQSYTCYICHKIFLSYFEMLRHSMSHKLNSKVNTPHRERNKNQPKAKRKFDIIQSDGAVPSGSGENMRGSINKRGNNLNSVSNHNVVALQEKESDSQTLESELSSEKSLPKSKKRKKSNLSRFSKCSNNKSVSTNPKTPTVVKLEHPITEDSSLLSTSQLAKHKAVNSDDSNQLSKNDEVSLFCKEGSLQKIGTSSSDSSPVLESNIDPSHSQNTKNPSTDNICTICDKTFSSHIYKKRHMNFMHKDKPEERTDDTVAAEVNCTKKRGRKKVLAKNHRRAFQRECKKQVISKNVNNKVHDLKKGSSAKKSPIRKSSHMKMRNSR